MKALSLLLLGLLLFTGCTSLSSSWAPGHDRSKVKRIFVERRLADNHGLNDIMVTHLQKLGYDASTGPITMMPDKVDLLLTYEDRWQWDFYTYMIEFNITARDPRSSEMLARSRYFRPSIFQKNPNLIVNEVVSRLMRPDDKLSKKKKKKAPDDLGG